MKRIIFIATAVALLCFATPNPVEGRPTKSTVDMSHMNKIFVGWVDLSPDEYRLLDYDTKAEWTEVINKVNVYFQEDLKTTYFPDRTLTMAKDKDDEKAAGSDLYIKFSNVMEDKGYKLHIAVHFIDPKTGDELALIPEDKYGAHVCGLEGCIQKELNKVGELIKKQVSGKN